MAPEGAERLLPFQGLLGGCRRARKESPSKVELFALLWLARAESSIGAAQKAVQHAAAAVELCRPKKKSSAHRHGRIPNSSATSLRTADADRPPSSPSGDFQPSDADTSLLPIAEATLLCIQSHLHIGDVSTILSEIDSLLLHSASSLSSHVVDATHLAYSHILLDQERDAEAEKEWEAIYKKICRRKSGDDDVEWNPDADRVDFAIVAIRLAAAFRSSGETAKCLSVMERTLEVLQMQPKRSLLAVADVELKTSEWGAPRAGEDGAHLKSAFCAFSAALQDDALIESMPLAIAGRLTARAVSCGKQFALSLLESGAYEESFSALEMVANMERTLGGESRGSLLSTLKLLGTVQLQMGRAADAQQTYEECIRIAERRTATPPSSSSSSSSSSSGDVVGLTAFMLREKLHLLQMDQHCTK